jgi:hypothetical protein
MRKENIHHGGTETRRKAGLRIDISTQTGSRSKCGFGQNVNAAPGCNSHQENSGEPIIYRITIDKTLARCATAVQIGAARNREGAEKHDPVETRV